MLKSVQLSERGQRIVDGQETRPGILLAANYSNRVGYAWDNIHQLFEVISREFYAREQAVWISFDPVEPPVALGSRNTIDGFLELPGRPSSLREYRVWLGALRRLGIRVIYFTDRPCWHGSYALFRLAGVRRILVHSRISVPDPRPAPPERGWRGSLKWLAGRVPLVAADRVYAVSGFVRDRLVNKVRFPSRRIVTILNGVDLVKFSPREKSVPNSEFRMYCGGRASHHKGIDVLIKATAMLRDRGDLPAFKVSYAGDGPDLDAFKALADAHGLSGIFEFLGRVETTAELVREADVVVVPSVWGDACPSAVSEALACGKALVATRAGGIPEQVGDPQAALLVEPGNAGELAEAIASLMLDPGRRRTLALAARARAEAALDERRYHDQVIQQMLRDCDLR